MLPNKNSTNTTTNTNTNTNENEDSFVKVSLVNQSVFIRKKVLPTQRY